ncbi:metal ABC transporter ATP-binding protein [Maridesulfovibrio hydrothermalis]|uniref:Zinc uptake system ATP-binding protein ZurA n=1 Tax=Maridesulfovibrio hydrothermalis AM13 = DSM 14728 TaxID=1121451 RepID=L0RGJ7_9BACT|nr:ATP-binding cassette domain-containing protein [Maridesulfovibrio hydrothermalis]CCO25340.1 Zinc uptake system ATP-binding protein ZurA [Maridesulfovibrio hydrothermalis AM13 = DSM 14728]
MSIENVIKFDNVSFGYEQHKVLDDISFGIAKGDYLAVIGPNGGGKTTLLKLLLGLLKPQQGSIEVLGMPPGRHGGQLGYMPQYTTVSESFPITVKDAVLMGKVAPGFKGVFGINFGIKAYGAVKKALERVGMLDHINRKVSDLSGGQKQRVFIARAIVDEPQMLLLDEPTASVDQAGKSGLYCLLRELNKDMTVIMVSHDISVLGQGVKSVACVNRKVHLHDQPKITREILSEAYGENEKGSCPIELITHGELPHRVLEYHSESDEGNEGGWNA